MTETTNWRLPARRFQGPRVLIALPHATSGSVGQALGREEQIQRVRSVPAAAILAKDLELMGVRPLSFMNENLKYMGVRRELGGHQTEGRNLRSSLVDFGAADPATRNDDGGMLSFDQDLDLHRNVLKTRYGTPDRLKLAAIA